MMQIMFKKMRIIQYQNKIKWIHHDVKIFSYYFWCYFIIHAYFCACDETARETKGKARREVSYGVVDAIAIVALVVEDVCFAVCFVFVPLSVAFPVLLFFVFALCWIAKKFLQYPCTKMLFCPVLCFFCLCHEL